MIFSRGSYLSDQRRIFFRALPSPNAHDRILCFAAHPDDEAIGAGGILAYSAAMDAEVRVVFVTDGNRRGLVQNLRHREALCSCRSLGIKPDNAIFLGLTDGSLSAMPEAELAANLQEFIASIRPTIVIGPSCLDRHSDHSTLARCLDAIQLAHILRLNYLIHFARFPMPHAFHPARPLLPPAPLQTSTSLDWAVFELSGNAFEAKHEALLCHRSQLRYLPMRRKLLGFLRTNELFHTSSTAGLDAGISNDNIRAQVKV